MGQYAGRASFGGVNKLRGAAWTVFCLDLVILAQAAYAALIAAEVAAKLAPNALRRLASLLPRDPAVAEAVGGRLRLSNKARKRLACAVGPVSVSAAYPAWARMTRSRQNTVQAAPRSAFTPPRLTRSAPWPMPRSDSRSQSG